MRRREHMGWLLLVILSILSSMIMTLVLVWVNIERTNTNYFINNIQIELQEKEVHRSKLEVEREYLLSPRELGEKAEELGLRQPNADQVRWQEIY